MLFACILQRFFQAFFLCILFKFLIILCSKLCLVVKFIMKTEDTINYQRIFSKNGIKFANKSYANKIICSYGKEQVLCTTCSHLSNELDHTALGLTIYASHVC